ncbi:hypothetical protein B0H67DRAFT_636649 [Lasiosphaeris hirsuta]|uniref:SPRY domain-containing protein n=1 Tax=Lasiosphaeris hirsuta TaxID=260670 RepID=A0AA40DLF7_9PEZI|nr:hypothetical protein B0H67DRAFT_636649 [Lasiosphaeris hirsuta]
MCFGRKERAQNPLCGDDEAPRPQPGYFTQKPANADPPKASVPQQQQQQQQQSDCPPTQPSSVSPPLLAPAPTSAPVQPAVPPLAEPQAVIQSSPSVELPSTNYTTPLDPSPSIAPTATGADHTAHSGLPPRASYNASPSGLPPSKAVHNWEAAVPATSLFPPPPALFSGLTRSPAINALKAEVEAGESWCADFPLAASLALDAPSLAALRAHDIRLMTPAAGLRGTLAWRAPGVWAGRTDVAAVDNCVIGYPPLYVVREHNPLATGQAKTVYYEVAVGLQGAGDVCLALGFAALPYPSFRLPGWNRGSLAVHGDDGHRYVNDQCGKSFTEPFRRGETYGIGMVFRGGSERIETEVYFTHGGRLVGGWNLHEETDVQDHLPVTGLEGYHDLSCAVGIYQASDFEIIFNPERWIYRPEV